MQNYKGFTVETIEDAPGKFKAVIRKAGGGTLRTGVPRAPMYLRSRRSFT
jgi:hypothetical protein